MLRLTLCRSWQGRNGGSPRGRPSCYAESNEEQSCGGTLRLPRPIELGTHTLPAKPHHQGVDSLRASCSSVRTSDSPSPAAVCDSSATDARDPPLPVLPTAALPTVDNAA